MRTVLNAKTSLVLVVLIALACTGGLLIALQNARSTAAETARERSQLRMERDDLQSDLNDTQTRYLRVAVAKNELDEDFAAQEAELQIAQGLLHDAQEKNHLLEADLSTTRTSLDDAQAALAFANGHIDQLIISGDEVKMLLAVTEGKLADLNIRYTNLELASGTLADIQEALEEENAEVARLEEDRSVLNEEIKALEQARVPLLLQTSILVPRCTGSMEPTITCLDALTFLTNPHPEDIVEGTTIAYEPCRADWSGLTLHRVIDIKVEDGTYYYWPQGDNNDEPDGCWVAFPAVTGYVVELNQNAHPENAKLRNFVNGAKADADQALAQHTATWNRLCGDVQEGETCYLPQAQVDHLERQSQDYVDAFDYWVCAINSAETAIYFNDGTAPIYRICVPALTRFDPP